MRSSLTPIACLVVLLLAPLAAAQVPPLPVGPPVYTVTLTGAPAAFTGLATNATVMAPFQVILTLTGVVCPAAVTVPVTITTTASGAPSFFSVMPEPSVINFTIPEGAYPGSPGPTGGGTGDSAAKATIAGNITANASVAVTVTALAPAPAGCTGAGAPSDATSEPVTIYANMTAPPPPPVEPTPEADSPGVGLLALVAVVALAAFASRRKRA